MRSGPLKVGKRKEEEDHPIKPDRSHRLGRTDSAVPDGKRVLKKLGKTI